MQTAIRRQLDSKYMDDSAEDTRGDRSNSDQTSDQAGHDSLYSNPIQQVIHLREKGEDEAEIVAFLEEKYDDDDTVRETLGMADMEQAAQEFTWDFVPNTVFRTRAGDSLTAREIGGIVRRDDRIVTGGPEGFRVEQDLYQPKELLESAPDDGESDDGLRESMTLSDFE